MKSPPIVVVVVALTTDIGIITSVVAETLPPDVRPNVSTKLNLNGASVVLLK